MTDYSNITTSDDPRLADAVIWLRKQLAFSENRERMTDAERKAESNTRWLLRRLQVLQMKARANG